MPLAELRGEDIEVEVPEFEIKIEQEDDTEVIPSTDESKGVSIFLLNNEGKVNKVIRDDLNYGVDEYSIKIEENTTEDEQKAFACELCGDSFRKLSSLKVHKEKLHDGVLYQCTECDYEGTDFNAVKRHHKYKHEDKEYSCDYCDYKHSVLNRVTFHVAEKHGEKYIKCDSCDSAFATQRGLNRHKYKKHRNMDKKFKCEECDYKSVWASDITRHVQARHESGHYKCDKCSYIGKSPRNLKRHMAKHGGNIFTCDKCEYISYTLYLMNTHIKDKHETDQLLKCDACDFECPAQWRMKRHVQDKHSIQIFRCVICDYGAKSKSLLYNHKRSVHTIFICSFCNQEERSQYLLKKHTASHTGEADEPSACDQCSFIGLNKRSLQYHQKKHKGNTFSCEKCDYSSPTIDQLRSHVGSKHGELKYKCDFCEFKFPANWRLKQHTERRHSNPEIKRDKKGERKEDNFDKIEVKLEQDLDHIVNENWGMNL